MIANPRYSVGAAVSPSSRVNAVRTPSAIRIVVVSYLIAMSASISSHNHDGIGAARQVYKETGNHIWGAGEAETTH
jgi:hypothetical protein